MRKIHILKSNKQKGQSMVEYSILFAVVVGVIVVAAITLIGQSLSGLYERTAGVIDDINPTLISSN